MHFNALENIVLLGSKLRRFCVVVRKELGAKLQSLNGKGWSPNFTVGKKSQVFQLKSELVAIFVFCLAWVIMSNSHDLKGLSMVCIHFIMHFKEMANQNSNNFQSKERTSNFFPFFLRAMCTRYKVCFATRMQFPWMIYVLGNMYSKSGVQEFSKIATVKNLHFPFFLNLCLNNKQDAYPEHYFCLSLVLSSKLIC